MKATPPVAVIGLDCGTPGLLFDRYAADMPTLSGLARRGLSGPLRSTVPPITVPAWSCMMSGRTPGELGIYGFRNRADHGYDGLVTASSKAVRLPRLWELASHAGKDSIVVAVPGTYPPSAIRGEMVSCFLTPSVQSTYTHPPGLRDEVQRVTGGYTLDVVDFRTDDKGRVVQDIFDMSEQRFRLAKHLATTRPWDFFMFVDISPDRLHHAFWRYCDPGHPRYEPDTRHADVFRDYYRSLDRHLAEFLQVLPDDTVVLIVSDHGGQPMVGGFCFNEWLRDRNLLVLAEEPDRPVSVRDAKVDWSRTIAWGDGGYYGRLFLNVEGREPTGTVPEAEYETVRQQLIDALEALEDHRGQPMGTRAFRPEEVYPEVRGVAPDLIVYFGDLRWRSVGRLGMGRGLYTFENDTGPDDANHAEDGVLVLAGDGVGSGWRTGLSLYDVAPTLQELLGIPAPEGQRGRVIT